jgi:hypothetical protein
MNTREKATQLVDDFSNECLLTTEGGKVAALIAVDEIISNRERIKYIDKLYWQEVKQEIEKL